MSRRGCRWSCLSGGRAGVEQEAGRAQAEGTVSGGRGSWCAGGSVGSGAQVEWPGDRAVDVAAGQSAVGRRSPEPLGPRCSRTIREYVRCAVPLCPASVSSSVTAQSIEPPRQTARMPSSSHSAAPPTPVTVIYPRELTVLEMVPLSGCARTDVEEEVRPWTTSVLGTTKSPRRRRDKPALPRFAPANRRHSSSEGPASAGPSLFCTP